MTANQDHLNFSDAQWNFLTVMYILKGPVHVDVAGTLAPLRPGELLDVLRRGGSAGMLKQSGHDTFTSDADPAQVSAFLNRNNEPFRRSLLSAIEENDLGHRVPSKALIRLLAEAGRKAEAADIALEQSRSAFSSGQLKTALDYAQTAMDVLTADTESTHEARLYIMAATTLADLRFRTGQALDDVSQYLDKARRLAESLGDKRSQALIGLHQGRLYYLNTRLEDTLSALEIALAEVETLGDDDILERTAEFRGLYAYLQGRYREALEQFERALSAGKEYSSPFIPLYLGFSAACLGQFHRSLGLVDTYANRCLQQGQEALAAHARALLAYILTAMGRGDEALRHLPDIPDAGSTAYWIAKTVRIYQTFTAGRIKDAHAALQDAAEQWGQTGMTFHQYPAPQLLEMIDAFDRLGLAPLPFLAIHDEIQRVMEGPNVHLRGVALRLKALRLPEGPWKHACLTESEDCLKQSGDPVETSKTRIELARLHLARGDQAQALVQILNAHEGLSALGELFFPDDLRRFLPKDSAVATPLFAGQPRLEDMAEMIADLIPSPNVQDLLGKLLTAVSGYVRAERAGLFRHEQSGVLLRSAHNLNADEVFSEVFRGSLAMVFEAYNRREPLCRPVPASEGPPRRVLCLPVDGGVLYFDNSYDRQAFDFMDAAMLRGLSRILSTAILKIQEYGRARAERDRTFQHQPAGEQSAGGVFLTASPRMHSILVQLDRAAASDATILIIGETGVGKELLARRVHNKSLRKIMPMITVDLATIPETLVESELFGYEKGAFTGADSQRKGRVELADKGTLFIDELGEVPPTMQVKLLRTLQEKTCMRLGGGRLIATDFRLVAATNRNLGEEVKAGRFRQDLYYRVNVMPLHIPPLRERPEDVRMLARHFAERYAAKYQNSTELTAQDEVRLLSYPWPGNVRELQNVIERGVLLAEGHRINLSLPLDARPSASHPFADMPTLDELQRRYIAWVLERTSGRIGGREGAAEILGMKRTSLNARLKKLGLR